jgi:glycosyltransferase involved in cell wall biosynthesis
MPRVFFVNRFFFPDQSATSQILSDLAFDLAASGTSVHVITSMQRYEDPGSRLPASEVVNHVQVTRVSTTNFGRAWLPGRAIDYFSFYAAALRALRSRLEKQDTVVAMTDPPLLSVVAMLAAKHRGADLINWLQDIYPEVAAQLGVPFLKGPVGSMLAGLRDRSLHAATANVVLGSVMADRLRSFGCRTDRIHIIHNWSDDENVTSIPASDNPLRRRWGLQDKFVVGYSGNLGRAHEFETVLDASVRLKDNPRIIFVMIGSGQKMQAFARLVSSKGLSSTYRFFPYQERSSLAHSLTAPDVHWISLKPELEGLIVPSKFYGVAAAGRPTIAITSQDGEIARLIREHQCGIVIKPGDGEGLAAAIERLSKDTSALATMGGKARAMLDTGLKRRQAVDRWKNLLAQIGQLPTARA